MTKRPSPYLDLLEQRKEAFLPEVQELAREGRSPAEISARLGVPKATINRWLRKLWLDSIHKTAPDTAVLTGNVLNHYRAIHHQAMRAWKRSQTEPRKAPAEEPAAKNEVDSNADGSSNRDDRRGSKKNKSGRPLRPGNPAFLGKAMDALKAVREIKALDRPRRMEVAGSARGTIPLAVAMDEDLRNMSDEQLAELGREVEARIRMEKARQKQANQLHDLHQAGLPSPLAPQGTGGHAGSSGDGVVPAADGLPPAPARQE